MNPAKRSFFCAGAASIALVGCGFKMRGFDLGLPFKTIAIQGEFEVAREVRQMIESRPGVLIATKPMAAQVVLIVASQQLDRTVTAFNAAGRPREVQLRMRVTYRITDGLAIELSSTQEIVQIRDVSVTESEVLAQPAAEAFLREDMQRDIAQQLIRRLRAVKLSS
ncbi:MAG: LPS assembly lipoprotein LptE [Burkholderiaceae bacterium]